MCIQGSSVGAWQASGAVCEVWVVHAMRSAVYVYTGFPVGAWQASGGVYEVWVVHIIMSTIYVYTGFPVGAWQAIGAVCEVWVVHVIMSTIYDIQDSQLVLGKPVEQYVRCGLNVQ